LEVREPGESTGCSGGLEACDRLCKETASTPMPQAKNTKVDAGTGEDLQIVLRRQ